MVWIYTRPSSLQELLSELTILRHYFLFETFFLPVTKAVMHLRLKILSCVPCSPPNSVCLFFLVENVKIPLPRPPQPHPKNLQRNISKDFPLKRLTCLLDPFPCSPLQTQHLWHSCRHLLLQALEQSPCHLSLPHWHNCICSHLTLQCHQAQCPKGWVSQRKLCLLAFPCFLWTSEAQSSVVFSA